MGKQPDYKVTRAPWAPDQVASLNAYQATGIMHPFTCGDHECRAAAHPKQATLIAYPDGWYCPRCRYTQDWAHTWMADWSWEQLSVRHAAALMSTDRSVIVEDTGPMVTKTGRVLTDADVEAWAAQDAGHSEKGPQS